MYEHQKRFPQSMIWIVAIAVVLFSVTGMAALMGWLPPSMGFSSQSGPPLTPALTRASTNHASTQSGQRERAQPICANCGVIESTREVAVAGDPSGLGAAGGAVVGGLLGNQIGDGKGKQIATVLGAVGGVMAGNEVEKRMKSSTSYEVAMKMADGSHRVIMEPIAGNWRAGDRVKVVDGKIIAN
jgi:outer membrane lipoprotein SlyB